MMKVAILGATGPSGVQLVKEALRRGHAVTALVRNPDKLKASVDKVNVYCADSMVSGMEGHDAVLSCLGCTPSLFSLWSVRFYSDTAKHITEAMRKASVSRLVFMTSWYTKYDKNDPFIVNWVFKPLVLGQSLHDMGRMEDWLDAECPDIDYTSVRCPQLTNGQSSGKPVIVEENAQQVSGNKGYFTTRQDVSTFMLDIIERNEYKRTCVSILSGT